MKAGRERRRIGLTKTAYSERYCSFRYFPRFISFLSSARFSAKISLCAGSHSHLHALFPFCLPQYPFRKPISLSHSDHKSVYIAHNDSREKNCRTSGEKKRNMNWNENEFGAVAKRSMAVALCFFLSSFNLYLE